MECVYLRQRFLWHFRWKRWFIGAHRRIPVDVHDDNEVVEGRAIAFTMDVLRTRTQFSSNLCVTNRTIKKFRNWSAATETFRFRPSDMTIRASVTTTRRATSYYNFPASKRSTRYSKVFPWFRSSQEPANMTLQRENFSPSRRHEEYIV